MLKVPLIKPDLPSVEEVGDQFKEILQNGKITNFSKYVSLFEAEAGAYLGTQTATVSSGSMGLLFSLQAFGLKNGQKVILPSFTFMATAQAVLYAGGIPVFAEIDDDLNLAVSDLEYLLNKHDDAAMVLPVHIYGLPCRITQIQELVDDFSRKKSRRIPVLYDAAHAFGSAVDKRKVGSFGNAEVFSLSVTKLLVSVEGGMVSSKDAEFIQRIKKMRNYGIKDNYNAHWQGMNGKMSEFHAIVGLYNLRRIDRLLKEREQKARYYLDKIKNNVDFEVQSWPQGITHTFKDLTILVPEASLEKRDAVMAFLQGKGIETRAYFYPPVHEQEFFRTFCDRPLSKTSSLSRRVITLPFYTSITKEGMDYVVKALIEAQKIL